MDKEGSGIAGTQGFDQGGREGKVLVDNKGLEVVGRCWKDLG